jgi:ribonuclease P protein component
MGPPDVRRVLDDGQPLRGNRVILFLAPGSGKSAVVVGRRVGGAVQRNRARRILREAWRQVVAEVAEVAEVEDRNDAVLVARVSIRGARTQDLVREMTELLRRRRIRL